MLSNLVIEIFWNTLMAVMAYFCWYYPIGLYQNAVSTHEVISRGGLVFLFIWAFMMFTSTFTHILIAGIDSADSAGSVGNVCLYAVYLFLRVRTMFMPSIFSPLGLYVVLSEQEL